MMCVAIFQASYEMTGVPFSWAADGPFSSSGPRSCRRPRSQPLKVEPLNSS